MSEATTTKKRSGVDRFLAIIERAGNALPHPATLFAILALVVVLISWIADLSGMSAIHPATGEPVTPKNLLSAEGLHFILTKMVVNFTGFAPLGTVLVALLGIGIAEGSGLIGAVLRAVVLASPKRLLTFVIVFAGVMSNAASEVGYVLLVPLAAVIFLAAGRHPLAGLAAAFAGVSGGYSANLLLGTIDPLLAGLSQEAARIIRPDYLVNPACNYYFMAVSTFLIAGLGTWVTERIVVPRLGDYSGDEKPEEIRNATPQERKGMLYAMLTVLVVVGIILWGLIPENGFLRDPKTGEILHSPFMSGIVALIFLSASLAGIAYGIGAGTFKSDNDVMKGMAKSMETLGSYIVLVFFAAQFVAYFNETRLGLILAIKGADVLKAADLGPIPLMLCFVLISAAINLIMGSASAKWAIMAPVFIPMFMLLGYSPEFTQMAYRVGDSVTNIISPMMSYFALIVAFIARYDKKAGIGTVISTMLPYSIVFLIGWSALLVIWVLLELPIGPGASMFIK
ncbi:MAG: AbgT family transporter [Flavobacteriales bacterium]|nr:AbgT family transporter [Flavobacteriales bacterium]